MRPNQKELPPCHARPPALARTAICVVALAAGVIGCSTPNVYLPSETGASLPVDPPTETMAIAESSAPVLGHDVIENNLPPEFTRALRAPAVTTNRWGATWVSLERWASEMALGSPQRTVVSGASKYSIATRSGVCVLTIGSRLAHWNGTAVWLGFAPQFMGGRPYVHFIDAEKTLQPLVNLPPSPANLGRTIVVDPGHGGADAGTRGANGEREKDYTLDWALRVERLLTNAGWNVVLTRRFDVEMPLADRVAIADRAKADVFISLHFNSTHPNPGPSGIETYCLTPHRAPSTLLRGYADDVAAAFPNNGFDAANLQLAYRVQREAVAGTGSIDLGVKRARFMAVLRYQDRPAILIEGGFLSNPAELGKISSQNFREALAVAVARALQSR